MSETKLINDIKKHLVNRINDKPQKNVKVFRYDKPIYDKPTKTNSPTLTAKVLYTKDPNVKGKIKRVINNEQPPEKICNVTNYEEKKDPKKPEFTTKEKSGLNDVKMVRIKKLLLKKKKLDNFSKCIGTIENAKRSDQQLATIFLKNKKLFMEQKCQTSKICSIDESVDIQNDFDDVMRARGLNGQYYSETEDSNNMPTEIASSNSNSTSKAKFSKCMEVMKVQRNKIEASLQEKCIEYLNNWQYDRDSWKFEVLRQMWLQNNLFNGKKVPDEIWPIAVQYFKNSSEKTKRSILKKAQFIVDINPEHVDETEYKRANEIVKLFKERVPFYERLILPIAFLICSYDAFSIFKKIGQLIRGQSGDYIYSYESLPLIKKLAQLIRYNFISYYY